MSRRRMDQPRKVVNAYMTSIQKVEALEGIALLYCTDLEYLKKYEWNGDAVMLSSGKVVTSIDNADHGIMNSLYIDTEHVSEKDAREYRKLRRLRDNI